MITTTNLKDVLRTIGFEEKEQQKGVFSISFPNFFFSTITVNFNTQKIEYPQAIKVWDKTSSGNFQHPENFVVLECVCRLLQKGYRPEHIELKKEWKMGHTAKSGKADIVVYDEKHEDVLLIIECKTAGEEYKKELTNLKTDGGQLFSYWQQEGSTQWLALYIADYKNDNLTYENTIVKCTDDTNILAMADKDNSILTYKKAHTVQELYTAWTETYLQTTYDNIIFSDKTQAYQIGLAPLKKGDLKEFTPDDKIVNRFEEILRHNNVSDKENAFNRLIALFICKLVDEIKKNDNDIVDFQYKVGTDSYETLQDRLQRLHQIGMQDFMQEKITYVDDNYAENLFATYSSSNRKEAIKDLKRTIRILKYYSNNDFAFKDVHNEELFYQNGKILVEVVQLFERYRIVYATKHQFLGDLFEQLLAKGFKQNEGQFFTPMPITRFIWDSLPLDKIIRTQDGYILPKVIDYACGAGHFLTEAVEAINDYIHRQDKDTLTANNAWTEKNIFGIEKDYRLARVAKVSLYMNGAGQGQILFGDGLDNYPDKHIDNNSFDILVANPPYSVDAFKAHLKLKNNDFELLNFISNNGNVIETLFVERIAQLLRPRGIAAVILPVSILSNPDASYVGAREQLLKHFYLRAIVQLGNKTFGATGTNTVILFLEKYNEPPKRKEQVLDSVRAILNNDINIAWEDKTIYDAYCKKIAVAETDYNRFVNKSLTEDDFKHIPYFAEYWTQFSASSDLVNLKKKEFFKKMPPAEQAKKILTLFYEKLQVAEQEKIYYFALVYNQKTLIITAPKDNNEQKQFLGYDWSNRRGNEGIQITKPGGMLYNDTNRQADHTLASLVRATFEERTVLLSDLERYYIYAQLSDMIDFSRPSFTKSLKNTVDKQVVLVSRWPIVKLGEICEIKIGGTPSRNNPAYFTGKNLWVSIAEMQGQVITDTKEKITDEAIKASNVKLIPKGTTLLSFKLSIGKTAIAGADLYTNEAIAALIPRDSTKITDEYLFNLFNGGLIDLSGGDKAFGSSLNTKFLNNEVKIPLPSLEIQSRIVSECGLVDAEYNSSRMSIEENRQKIAGIFDRFGKKDKTIPASKMETKKLGEIISTLETGSRPQGGVGMITEGVLSIGGEHIDNINGTLNLSSPKYVPQDYFHNATRGIVQENDVLLCKDGALTGKVALVRKELEGKEAMINEHVFIMRCNNLITQKYLFSFLYSYKGQELLKANLTGSAQGGLNSSNLKEIKIPVPSLSEQSEIVSEVERYESLIASAQAVMQSCAARKKSILDHYLQ